MRQVVQRLRLEPARKKRGRPFVYTWPMVVGCFMVLVTYLAGVAYNGSARRPPRALKSLVA